MIRNKGGEICMNKINGLDLISLILLIVGGLNWGLIGLMDYNLVTTLFGDGSILTQIVYILVGLAAIYTFVTLYKLSSNAQIKR